jgi:hypothetical protein
MSCSSARYLTVILLLAAVAAPAAGSWLNDPDNNYEVRLGAEMGFLGVLKHNIQFGNDPYGTPLDYVAEGGQNILFPFQRMSAELHLKPRHTIVLLYQPIDLRTEARLVKDLVVDSTRFPAGTAMNFRYGFDFYRVSYQYDFWPEPERELAVGISLQIRDAAISFVSKDGELARAYNDIGPVPVIRFRGRLPLTSSSWVGTEIDGFYAQGKFVTGSTNVESSFRGAILDASLRYGLSLNQSLDGFVNARYVGGGASGQQIDPENVGASGYTDNWLGAFSLSVGMYIK